MAPLRIVFAGTPEFAARHLDAILKSHHDVISVYTQPDRRAGRGKKMLSSPVKQLAEKENLSVYQPSSLKNSQEQEKLAKLNPDVIVVVAFGMILPKEILSVPKFGCVNVHASLLPRWRGAAPIERALLAGDKVSGVTIISMDEGLDTGNILLTSEVEILDTDTRESLENKLIATGCVTLIDALSRLNQLLKTAIKQDDSKSCYADKLDKSDALINWNCDTAVIDRKIRAGIGRHPAYTFLEGKRIRVISAEIDSSLPSKRPGIIQAITKEYFTVACGIGSLRVFLIQMPGKTPVTISDVINSGEKFLAEGKEFKSDVNSK